MKLELLGIYSDTWKDFKHVIQTPPPHDNAAYSYHHHHGSHNISPRAQQAIKMAALKTDQPIYFSRVMPDATVLILTVELFSRKCLAKLYMIDAPQMPNDRNRHARHDINFIVRCCALTKSSSFQSLCFDLHVNFLRNQLAKRSAATAAAAAPFAFTTRDLKRIIDASVSYYGRLIDTSHRIHSMTLCHALSTEKVPSSTVYEFLVRYAKLFGFKSVAPPPPPVKAVPANVATSAGVLGVVEVARKVNEAVLYSLEPLDAKTHLPDCPRQMHDKHAVQLVIMKEHDSDGYQLRLRVHIIFTERKVQQQQQQQHQQQRQQHQQQQQQQQQRQQQHQQQQQHEFVDRREMRRGSSSSSSGGNEMDRSQLSDAPFQRSSLQYHHQQHLQHLQQHHHDIRSSRRSVDIRNVDPEVRKLEEETLRRCEVERTRERVSELLSKLEIECERSILYQSTLALARERSTCQSPFIKADLQRLMAVSRVLPASHYEPNVDKFFGKLRFDKDGVVNTNRVLNKFSYYYVVSDNFGKRFCVFPTLSDAADAAGVMVLIAVNLAGVVTSFSVVLPSSYVTNDEDVCDRVARVFLEAILVEFFNFSVLQRNL